MRIVVCVKPINAKLIDSDSDKRYRINPYEVFALSEINRMKENQDIEVICLMMGRVDQRIASELKMLGADRIIFACDHLFAGADTLATTYVLYKAIKKIGPVDFIVCGDHALDGETGHVGPALAERLGYSFIGNITSLSVEDTSIQCICEEDGHRFFFKAKSGTVISVSGFILKELVLSILQLRKMNSLGFEVWNAGMLDIDPSKCGLSGSATKVVGTRQLGSKNTRKSICIDMQEGEVLNHICNILQNRDRRADFEN